MWYFTEEEDKRKALQRAKRSDVVEVDGKRYTVYKKNTFVLLDDGKSVMSYPMWEWRIVSRLFRNPTEPIYSFKSVFGQTKIYRVTSYQLVVIQGDQIFAIHKERLPYILSTNPNITAVQAVDLYRRILGIGEENNEEEHLAVNTN